MFGRGVAPWRRLPGLTVPRLLLLLASLGLTVSSGAFAAPYKSSVFGGELRGSARAPDAPLSLWYRRPARAWVEALALGNGRLGAMVFGGIEEEQLQLNEDTLWAGGPHDPSNADALGALPKVRALIFAGQYRRAHEVAEQHMLARPRQQAPYQTLGSLLLRFPSARSVADYRRDLNLDEAVARVAYSIDGVRYTRETFVSPVDQVLVMRLAADQP